MMGKLSELLVSGNCTRFFEVATSPRSPLDFKIQSPRGLKNYDFGGVGLGIVAALDKSSDVRREILIKHAISSSSSNRSDPIPVNCVRFRGELKKLESLEDYTYVTCHAPNKSFTKVYYDGGEYGRSGHQRNGADTDRRCNNVFVLNESSPAPFAEDIPVFPKSDFLSSCNLCKKKLHGKDIYMYRGEKAFCSTECRSRQIMMDERKEQCRSEASRSADISNLPYSRSQIFSTGILAI